MPDYATMLSQYLWYAQILANGQTLSSPDDYKKYADLKTALEDPAVSTDVKAALDANPDQAQQIAGVRQKLLQQGGAGAPAPADAGAAPAGVGTGPGGATLGADGKYHLSPEQLGALMVSLAANAGGAGGGDESVVRTTAQQTSRNAETRGTAVVYNDLPTPEKYMDDWDRGFQTHVAGLAATGGLSNEAAEWARGQSTLFYGQYIRAQLADALKGKPMFRSVGLNPDNKLVGTRQGAFDTSHMTAAQKEAYDLQQTSSGTGGMSVTALDSILNSGPSINAGDVSAARSAAAVSGGGEGHFKLSETGTVAEDNQQLSSTQEALVQRNQLSYVASLSPLDFLKDSVDAGKLNLLYAGQKGTAAAAQQISAPEETGVRRAG